MSEEDNRGDATIHPDAGKKAAKEETGAATDGVEVTQLTREPANSANEVNQVHNAKQMEETNLGNDTDLLMSEEVTDRAVD